MHNHNLDGMADMLIEFGIIQPTDKEKAVEALQKYWGNKIADVWTLDDVMGQAADMTLPRAFSEDDGLCVLHRLPHVMDATIGINIYVIQEEINTHIRNNPEPVVL